MERRQAQFVFKNIEKYLDIESFIFKDATSDGNSIKWLSFDGSRFVCRVFAEVLAQGTIIPADLGCEVRISLLPAKPQ